MKVTINKSVAKGSIKAPPSKSMAHRLLICAALTPKSEIKNIDFSEDILATLDCLKALGASVETNGDCVNTGNLNPFDIEENTVLYCRESGSTLRFLLPLCMLSGKRVILKGSQRLLERPLSVYEDICRKCGILFENDGKEITVCGKLKSGNYDISGEISSQFITGMMFALSLMKEKSQITVKGGFESRSYCDLTADAINSFGGKIYEKNNIYYIESADFSSFNTAVEGDWSNGAYLEVFGIKENTVTVTGLNKNSFQGDKVYRKMFSELKSKPQEFDLSNCPDLAPVMFSAAAVLSGAKFCGTKRLKLKESDRAKAMAEELLKFGIETVIGENTVEIKKGVLKKPEEPLYGHNDHRIVMALSFLLSITGGEIEGAQAVNKSFPLFFEKIKSLGIEVNVNGA